MCKHFTAVQQKCTITIQVPIRRTSVPQSSMHHTFLAIFPHTIHPPSSIGRRTNHMQGDKQNARAAYSYPIPKFWRSTLKTTDTIEVSFARTIPIPFSASPLRSLRDLFPSPYAIFVVCYSCIRRPSCTLPYTSAFLHRAQLNHLTILSFLSHWFYVIPHLIVKFSFG